MPTLENARQLRLQGSHREALGLFNALDKSDPAVLCEMAHSALYVDPTVAEKLAIAALSRAPGLALANHHLGEALARQARFDEAVAPLRAAVARDGSLAELLGRGGAPWGRRFAPVRCSHCGEAEASPIWVGNTSRSQRCLGHIDPVKVWTRCDRCGLTRVLEPPPVEHLVAYYDALRAADGDVGAPQVAGLFDELLRWDDVMQRILALSAPGPLLEIGSAWGSFCAVAAYHGFEALGLETAPNPVAWSRDVLGVRSIEGTAPNDLPKGPFQVIALWEVIEHFADPGAVLRALRDRLAPGGVLALSTPCLDHPLHRARGYDDPMWSVPGHLVYFDRVTLQQSLEAAGFSVRQRWFSPRHLGSVVVLAS